MNPSMPNSRAVTDEARLRAIIRSAMEVIIVVDDTQHVVIFNPMAERVFGYAAADMIGAPLERFMPERHRVEHRAHVERFGATGVSERPMGGQRRLFGLRANGEEFPVEASISQIKVGDGKLYTVMLRDISERVRAENALHASREDLRRLSGGIQAAREEEKKRIAREIHDDFGQQLTALNLNVTILEFELRAHADKAVLLEQVQQIYTLLDRAVSSVRRIAADLRPAMLDDLGLESAIEWLITDFSERYGIAVTNGVDIHHIDFTPDAASAIFRIVQEALTNVARHAHATTVNVELRLEDRGFVVQVSDDGCGVASDTTTPSNSFGLLGVRERAHLLDGDLDIISAPGKGFRLTVVLSAAALKGQLSGGKP